GRSGRAEERLHRDMTFAGNPCAREHRADRAEEDFQIQNEAEVIDVPRIESEPLVPAREVSSVDGGPTGDAREHGVTPSLFGAVAIEVLDQQRPRTDQAHVPEQHVEELRELVQAQAAERLAEPGETLIV